MKNQKHYRFIHTAHIPSYLKAWIMHASQGRDTDGAKWSYYCVGYELSKKDDVKMDEPGLQETIKNLTPEDLSKPTTTIQRIFSDERHPKGLLNVIPKQRRRNFLQGLKDGMQGLEHRRGI